MKVLTNEKRWLGPEYSKQGLFQGREVSIVRKKEEKKRPLVRGKGGFAFILCWKKRLGGGGRRVS